MQIVRYSETPVGPYDELVIVPGDFEVPVLNGSGSGEGNGEKKKVKKNSRITGIWVSQKDTCWNGGLFHLLLYPPAPLFPPLPSFPPFYGFRGEGRIETRRRWNARLTADETKNTT